MYSKKVHRGKYERYSILWPFFQWGSTFQDKKEPVHYKLFFPFFGFKDSETGNMKSRGFLILPLLGSLFGYGYDKRTGEKDYNALFFCFNTEPIRTKIIINLYYSLFSDIIDSRLNKPHLSHLFTFTYRRTHIISNRTIHF
ncbi:hypothetical protein LEP1GSC127_0863 [Leptospira kirschneri str. 200801925]|nr:hypothetical protein LEP1GSC127_0863 [Leptospira kirschneri str. 200801925]